jgi:hypothetical protein
MVLRRPESLFNFGFDFFVGVDDGRVVAFEGSPDIGIAHGGHFAGQEHGDLARHDDLLVALFA